MELRRPREKRIDRWFRKWELWEDDKKYLTRYHIWPFKPNEEVPEEGSESGVEDHSGSRFKIFVHRMDGPDLDRWPHDHPWWFRSIIFRGGYTDEQTTGDYQCGNHVYAPGHLIRHKWFQKMPATGLYHRILTIHRQPTWTLVLTGQKKRTWGYLTDQGWVPHEGD